MIAAAAARGVGFELLLMVTSSSSYVNGQLVRPESTVVEKGLCGRWRRRVIMVAVVLGIVMMISARGRLETLVATEVLVKVMKSR